MLKMTWLPFALGLMRFVYCIENIYLISMMNKKKGLTLELVENASLDELQQKMKQLDRLVLVYLL